MDLSLLLKVLIVLVGRNLKNLFKKLVLFQAWVGVRCHAWECGCHVVINAGSSAVEVSF